MFGGEWAERTLETFRSLPTPPDTRVGNDVWIGRGATIMPGVSIGAGAVVAARSVVTKDVEPYALVSGNPARPLRSRFADEDVALLLEARWWDWPVEAVTEHAAVIMGGTPARVAAIAREVLAD